MVVDDKIPSSTSGLLKGEHRQLTAFFYDLVGSTGFITELDPEDFHEIQSAVHQFAREVITNHDGFVDIVLGDGGFAYFGYPIADEDAARKAVSAGLSLVDHNFKFSIDLDRSVLVRVGIATASAVIGLNGSDEKTSREEVVGLAPTMASRIQSVAEPGTVAVSNSTYLIVRKLFEFAPLGVHSLRGIQSEQTLWRPIKTLKTDDRFTATRRFGREFVGRTEELETLCASWERAAAGKGQAFFIHGEPGVGKSRLVRATRNAIQNSACNSLVLQCEAVGANTPFFPLISLLRSIIKSNVPDFDFNIISPETLRNALKLPLELDNSDCSALAELLDTDKSRLANTDFDADDYNDHIVRALMATLETFFAAGPTLIIVEDLHWADGQTRKILKLAQTRLADQTVLLLITSRSAPPQEWLTEKLVSSMALAELDIGAVHKLVEGIIGPEAFSPQIGDAIARKSGGNAFFAEELAIYFRDQKPKYPEAETEWLDLFSSDTTASLQELLTARLDELGSAKIVVQAASTLGRYFNTALLKLVLSESGANVEFDRQIGRLLEIGFFQVYRSGDSDVFCFRHALLRDAAYQGLLKSTRRNLHRIVYSLIQEYLEFRQDLTESEIGGHAEKAHLFLNAARHYLLAGRLASQQSALDEARTVLMRALGVVRKTEEKSARYEELEIINYLGPVLTTQEGSGSKIVRDLYEHGVTVCRMFDKADLSRWFPIYWGWWFTAHDFQTQRKRADIILRDMTHSTETEIQLQAQHCKWATAFNLGMHSDCLAAINQGLALYNKETALAERTRFGGHDAKVCALGEYGLSLWFIGKTETAVDYVKKCLEWAEETEHLGSCFHALDIAIMLQRFREDIGELRRLVSDMHEIAEIHGSKPFEAKANIFGGWAMGMTGDPTAGRLTLKEGLAIQTEIGTEEDFPVYMEMLAELEGLSGNSANGVKITEQAIARAEKAGHSFWLAELFRRQALLRHAAGDPKSEVAAALGKARETAEQQGSRVLLLRILADTASMLPSEMTAQTNDLITRTLSHLEPGYEKDRLIARLSGFFT